MLHMVRYLQFMPLFSTRDFPKLFLRDPRRKSFQTAKHLGYILRIQHISLRLPNQSLDFQQAVANKMLSQPIINLLKYQVMELRILAFLAVENLIHKSCREQLLGCYPLAHDQGFICFAYAHSLHESTGRAAFRYETETGEGCQEEGMWHAVDEVGEGNKGGGETNGGAVECCDEDFGVRVEGLCDVQVVGYKALEPMAVYVFAFGDLSTQ
jgi:hypothetical protein